MVANPALVTFVMQFLLLPAPTPSSASDRWWEEVGEMGGGEEVGRGGENITESFTIPPKR